MKMLVLHDLLVFAGVVLSVSATPLSTDTNIIVATKEEISCATGQAFCCVSHPVIKYHYPKVIANLSPDCE